MAKTKRKNQRPNPEQVREEARKILLELRKGKEGSKKTKLSYSELAQRLGTSAYAVRKAMLIDSGDPRASTRWGAGRPRKDKGVLKSEIEWAVNKYTLRHQVGCSLRARAKAFNLRFPTRHISSWDLRCWYRHGHISRQKFYVREGRPELASLAEQEEELDALKARLQELATNDYRVVQIDEACFSSMKNDRRHWAPAGDPIEVREKYVFMPQIKVCAGIERTAGLVATLYSHEAFTHKDMIAMLRLIREFYGWQEKVAVFLDRASYHRSPGVKEAAKAIGVELVYNVAYRPDLNGIELLWRRAKVAYYNTVDSWRALGHRSWDQDELVRKCVEEIPRSDVCKVAESGWGRLAHA